MGFPMPSEKCFPINYYLYMPNKRHACHLLASKSGMSPKNFHLHFLQRGHLDSILEGGEGMHMSVTSTIVNVKFIVILSESDVILWIVGILHTPGKIRHSSG